MLNRKSGLTRKLAALAGATVLGLALVSTDATAGGFGGGGMHAGGMGGGMHMGGMGGGMHMGGMHMGGMHMGGFPHGGAMWHGQRFGAFHGGWNAGWHGGWHGGFHGHGPFFAHGFHRRFFGGPFVYGAAYYGGYGCWIWGPWGPVNVCYGPGYYGGYY